MWIKTLGEPWKTKESHFWGTDLKLYHSSNLVSVCSSCDNTFVIFLELCTSSTLVYTVSIFLVSTSPQPSLTSSSHINIIYMLHIYILYYSIVPVGNQNLYLPQEGFFTSAFPKSGSSSWSSGTGLTGVLIALEALIRDMVMSMMAVLLRGKSSWSPGYLAGPCSVPRVHLFQRLAPSLPWHWTAVHCWSWTSSKHWLLLVFLLLLDWKFLCTLPAFSPPALQCCIFQKYFIVHYIIEAEGI